MAQKKKAENRVRTFIKSTDLSSGSKHSHLAFIDVKDGRIVRTRPFRYDWKYRPEEFNAWKIEARGQTFDVPMKSLIAPFGLGYKKRVYSPNRIMYPLKRVDWNPDSERNPQNRGKSGYVRISWDEATDIVASEIKRIHKQYGPYAILGQADGHGETKAVHATHGCGCRLLELMGGFTFQVRNPDSWEGWYWGAKHVWGCEPVGLQWPYNANIIPDIAKHTELILCWGCDPETTPWGFAPAQMASRWFYWFTELGIKQIYVCPDLNYGAAVHADKWIPVLPNTDAALHLAIAYQWMAEGTYDKSYIATHTVGFDKFEEYVLGKEDGIPKTPKWASGLCGVPSRIIKALAREWASKVTSTAHGLGGPYIRGPYSHEPARLEVMLLAMQGLGRPGVHQHAVLEGAFFSSAVLQKRCFKHRPWGVVEPDISKAVRGYDNFAPMPKQVIPKCLVHEAILKGEFSIYGSGYQILPTEDQFKKYVYPVPGCSPVHMIWTDAPCLTTCWNDGNSHVKAYRHPSIEFMLAQHPWMENDCLFADIILPSNTKYETEDIGEGTTGDQFESIFLENKCVEPIGESKSEYEIVCLIAEKLGMLEKYTQGKTVQEWIKLGFDESGVPQAGLCDWEEFKEKQYYVVPTDPDWEKHPAGMYEFYKDPEKHPLATPTGKLEFESTNLKKHFPDDEERPPVPHWIPYGESHRESLQLDRAKRYPLLCQSNHPRWRVHANLDDVNWFKEIPTCKVRGADGYLYEPLWLHPAEAEKRGIKHGDVVNIFNERGGVLCGAYVTERVMPGVAYVEHGARYDPIIPGELDRGGAINTITPYNWSSRNAAGMVVSGFLVEVERVNLDKLKKQYPEAFNRPYDWASGLKFERVLEG
ncbi:MAG: molybdopterin-dependent oxidoreductase [Dehalococcoidales bacterium]|nr:molybdopterin-dependent oxidoreductase [Dehalococcoidales bacterium]